MKEFDLLFNVSCVIRSLPKTPTVRSSALTFIDFYLNELCFQLSSCIWIFTFVFLSTKPIFLLLQSHWIVDSVGLILYLSQQETDSALLTNATNFFFIIQMSVFYGLIWFVIFIFARVISVLLVFLTSVKCVHISNKCLVIFQQFIWILLFSHMIDSTTVFSEMCWWGGAVWGHWVLKWLPKIFNIQDGSQTFQCYQSFVCNSVFPALCRLKPS